MRWLEKEFIGALYFCNKSEKYLQVLYLCVEQEERTNHPAYRVKYVY